MTQHALHRLDLSGLLYLGLGWQWPYGQVAGRLTFAQLVDSSDLEIARNVCTDIGQNQFAGVPVAKELEVPLAIF